MRCIVIYFSQTGNTQKVAEAIQRGVARAAGGCDLLEIRQADPLGLNGYDLIGLGSPVMGAEPGNVAEFVNRLRSVGGKHVFTFCTHGTSAGFYFPSIYPKLKRVGLVVLGHADWYADCFLLHMPQPYPTAGHPDQIDLQEAEDYGWEITVRSMRVAAGETSLIPPAPPEVPPRRPSDPDVAPPPVIGQFSSLLKYDRSKCLYPRCSLCIDNCPTFGIDLSVDPPLLAKPCIDCEFCARLCPTGALDMSEWMEGMIAMTSGHWNKMLASLERSEAEGKFRRLLPVEELQNTPGWTLLKERHPQWVIGKGAQTP
jgi:ferredoxin